MGRTFSVRLNLRAASSALPWSRTVMRLVLVPVGELVVVVPAVLAVLVAVAVGADAGEFGEGEVAGFGEFADADGAAARVERDGGRLAVEGDGLVFDVGALLDASFRASGVLGVGFGGGDAVDRAAVRDRGAGSGGARRGVRCRR